tara:strand:- start:49 stop:228 length:180 start_codon:yes stop_codon:yes gene_type:complete
MNKKRVTVEVSYDTEETWAITLQEVEEIFQMMNNLKRNAKITNIINLLEVNNNDDGQDK